MLEFKPFNHLDWYGYAGAASFGPGRPPLMGCFKVQLAPLGKQLHATAVLDRDGLTVDVIGEDGCLQCVLSWEGMLAARAVALLAPEMTLTQLLAMPGCDAQSPDGESCTTEDFAGC